MPREFAGLIIRCCHSEPAARPSFALIAAELQFMDLTSLRPAPIGEVGLAAPGDLEICAPSSLARDLALADFPPRLAAALKSGRVVEPEVFDECVFSPFFALASVAVLQSYVIAPSSDSSFTLFFSRPTPPQHFDLRLYYYRL